MILDEGIIYENLAIISSLIVYTDKIKFIDDYLYYYIIRNTSIMHNGNFSLKKDDKIIAINKLSNRITPKFNDAIDFVLLKR